MRGLIGALAVVGSVLVVSGAGTWQQVSAYCQHGETPAFRFGFGFAALHDRLGATMGEPIECAYTNPDTGDAFQRTTTGIVYQPRGTNTPTFTNGREAWMLSSAGMAYGSGVVPPGLAIAPSGDLEGQLVLLSTPDPSPDTVATGVELQ